MQVTTLILISILSLSGCATGYGQLPPSVVLCSITGYEDGQLVAECYDDYGRETEVRGLGLMGYSCQHPKEFAKIKDFNYQMWQTCNP